MQQIFNFKVEYLLHYTVLFISLHKDILDMDTETVDKFLKEFKDKARAFGIIFRIDRKKNMHCLVGSEMCIRDR